MKTTSVAQLRSHLAAWLRRAQKGERILIERHGEVIAELRPAVAGAKASAAEDLELRLQRLEREGILRRGTDEWPDRLRGPVTGRPAPLLEALLAERDEGR